ncbi:MAG: hypothetical protein ACM674_02025 [Bacteroidales bacterium]
MTNFEVERMEAAFEYLENKLNDHYSYLLGCGDPERVKKAQSLIARRMIAYNEVKDALTAFSLFDESDAAIAENAFKDPENNDHVFAFSVSCKKFASEEHRQAGANAEQAEQFLLNHLAFEYCNSMTPDDFEIKLLGQMC